MRTTPRTPARRPQPHAPFELLSAHAQTEQAVAAARYLRRRREALACVLVALLGVLVARSIPLVAHEAAVCACRDEVRARALSGRDPAITGEPTRAFRGLTQLTAGSALVTEPEGPSDLVVTTEGAFLVTPRGVDVLGERCAGVSR